MITFSNEEGFIKPVGIEMFDSNLKELPHISIGVFSEHLYYEIVNNYKQ